MSTPPPAPIRYGYATKIRLASELDRLLLGGHYYVWFSLELNPVQNGESSNPLLLYRQIDTAVKKNDVNHSRIKDLRMSLVDAIVRLVKPGNRGLAKSLIAQVLGAPVEMFRPQLWRLNISSIAPARWDTTGATNGWDEHLVKDLAPEEFEVIVE
jgi:hypothetical protein